MAFERGMPDGCLNTQVRARHHTRLRMADDAGTDTLAVAGTHVDGDDPAGCAHDAGRAVLFFLQKPSECADSERRRPPI